MRVSSRVTSCCLTASRRSFFFFLQLLLRLLELPLLRLEGILALRLGGGRNGGERCEQHHPEHQALHGSRAARASQPPSPPRSVPAPSSATTPAGVKNTSWERPSVRLTSGSRRGATTEYVTRSAPRARIAPASPCIIPW